MVITFRFKWLLHSGLNGYYIQVKMVITFRFKWLLHSGLNGNYIQV